MIATADHEALRALELHLLTGETRRDAYVLNRLLAEEFREFGSSGRVYTRAEIVAELKVELAASFEMRDFRAEGLGEGVALVTYRSTRTEQGLPARESLRSSLWIRREGRWQMLFHQGTRVTSTA